MPAGENQRQRGDSESMVERLQADITAGEFDAHQKAALFNKILDVFISPQHDTLFWGDRMMTLDKSAGFFDDPAFHGAFEAIHGAHE